MTRKCEHDGCPNDAKYRTIVRRKSDYATFHDSMTCQIHQPQHERAFLHPHLIVTRYYKPEGYEA